MLVLSRRNQETIHIGPDIVITVVRMGFGVVRIGVDAPKELKILRGELQQEEAEPVSADASPSKEPERGADGSQIGATDGPALKQEG